MECWGENPAWAIANLSAQSAPEVQTIQPRPCALPVYVDGVPQPGIGNPPAPVRCYSGSRELSCPIQTVPGEKPELKNTGKGGKAGGDNIIVIWPCPARTIIHFEMKPAGTEKANISIFDPTGKQVAFREIAAGSVLEEDASGYAGGVYIVKLEGEGVREYRRFVVE